MVGSIPFSHLRDRVVQAAVLAARTDHHRERRGGAAVRDGHGLPQPGHPLRNTPLFPASCFLTFVPSLPCC